MFTAVLLVIIIVLLIFISRTILGLNRHRPLIVSIFTRDHDEWLLFPESKTYKIFSAGYAIYEYKIEGHDVFVRTIELLEENENGKHFLIQDNTLIDSDYLKKMLSTYEMGFSLYTKDELLARINWSPITDILIACQILKQHPENISKIELRKKIRSILEKLRSANIEFKKIALDLGVDIVEGKVIIPATLNSESKKKIGIEMDRLVNASGCHYLDIVNPADAQILLERTLKLIS